MNEFSSSEANERNAYDFKTIETRKIRNSSIEDLKHASFQGVNRLICFFNVRPDSLRLGPNSNISGDWTGEGVHKFIILFVIVQTKPSTSLSQFRFGFACRPIEY